MSHLATFLSGAVATTYGVASIFFFRFWKRAAEPLFKWFGIAFLLLAVNQALTGFLGPDFEKYAQLYSLRLLAFLLIIFAIVRKNVARD